MQLSPNNSEGEQLRHEHSPYFCYHSWFGHSGKNRLKRLMTCLRISGGKTPIFRRIFCLGKEHMDPHLIADVTFKPVWEK